MHQYVRVLLATLISLCASIGVLAQSVSSAAISPVGHQALAADIAVNARGDIAVMWVDRSPTQVAAEAAQAHAHHAPTAGAHAGQDRHIALTDLYVAVSSDGGKTFGSPVKVNATAGLVWGQAVSRPRIVTSSDGTWHVSYAANERHAQLDKTALTTHYTRSRDGAQTFERPRRLSTLTDQDLSAVIHGGFVSAAAFGSMAVTEDDAIAVVWIDTRHMSESSNSGALYVNLSRDGGESFTQERRILDTGVCPCCQIMAVGGRDGALLLGSRNVDQHNYRAATVMTLDRQGATSARRDIGAAPWQIEGCPLKPTVITRHDNYVYAAVHSGGESQPGVLFSVSEDYGERFTPRGLVHPAAGVSDSPSLATNGQSVLLVWHAKTTGTWSIFSQFYDLAGNPLGPIQTISSGATSARSPVVTHTQDGRYVVAWQQDGRIMAAPLRDVSP